jgi:hypothetical protein
MFLLAKVLNAMYCQVASPILSSLVPSLVELRPLQQVANHAYADLRGSAETGYRDVKQRESVRLELPMPR